jgi:DNA/RNA endonuclease YhcR with UshA esterase domain
MLRSGFRGVVIASWLCLAVLAVPTASKADPASEPHSPETNSAAAAPATQGSVLSAADTEKLLAVEGQRVAVTGIVSTAKWSASGKVMNVEFEDAANGLLVAIFKSGKSNLEQVLGPDLVKLAPGAGVAIRGVVKIYRERPEIVVSSPFQIKLTREASQEIVPTNSITTTMSPPKVRGTTAFVVPANALDAADIEKLRAAVGQQVVITGKVDTAAWSQSGKVMNIHFENASEGLVAAIFLQSVPAFNRALGGDPSKALPRQTVAIKGKLGLYRERPQIILNDPAQLQIIKDAALEAKGKPDSPKRQ